MSLLYRKYIEDIIDTIYFVVIDGLTLLSKGKAKGSCLSKFADKGDCLLLFSVLQHDLALLMYCKFFVKLNVEGAPLHPPWLHPFHCVTILEQSLVFSINKFLSLPLHVFVIRNLAHGLALTVPFLDLFLSNSSSSLLIP